MSKNVIIVGAGPAGLTAAYRLINQGYKVTILESDPKYIGGISRTVEYNGYRFDIGGHRFFSKNEEVMAFWDEILKEDFLKRPRLSRWFYRGKFFHYPIKPFELLKVFGIFESFLIVLSYAKAKLFPKKPEVSLADWCVNNFGSHLAQPFFINYNKKLWGVDPKELSKDFTLQRIKGVSFVGTIIDSFKKLFGVKGKTAKSLIEKFNYPKYGPGMLWERVASIIKSKGGLIIQGAHVKEIHMRNGALKQVVYTYDNKDYEIEGDYLLSTMPLAELIKTLRPLVPKDVLASANKLRYRDFITVALMIDQEQMPPDNWIYTHDEGIQAIRIQLFKNWSPFMVPDPNKTCIGFEYVCNEGDVLWKKSDDILIKMAKEELDRLGFAKSESVFDGKVVRLKNVYPTYLLDYSKNVETIKNYINSIVSNYSLQPMGRGGLHRYNNSDHSMMTAFLCVKNITGEGKYDQWLVNTDAEYHEENK